MIAVRRDPAADDPAAGAQAAPNYTPRSVLLSVSRDRIVSEVRMHQHPVVALLHVDTGRFGPSRRVVAILVLYDAT